MPSITGCDSLFVTYTDFFKSIVHSSTAVNGARSIEAVLAAANGANRMYVFAGIADVNIDGGADDHLLLGRVEIIIDALTVNPGGSTPQEQFVDLDMTNIVEYIDGNAYAGLAGFSDNGADRQTSFAVDCISVGPAFRILNGQQRFVPLIQIATATRGALGWTHLTRIAYQANLQVLVTLGFDVATVLGGFGPSVTITSGDSWVARVSVPSPAPSTGLQVRLISLKPDRVPVPASVLIPPNKTSIISAMPVTPKFSAPPEFSVPVVATVQGISTTAIVNIKAHP